MYCLLGPNVSFWLHSTVFSFFNSNPWSFKYCSIHLFPATLTGAPKSNIITWLLFSVTLTWASPFSLYSSHQFTFNPFAASLNFSQLSYVHPVQLSSCFLSFFLPVDLPLSCLFPSLLSLDLFLFWDTDLISLEKLLCLLLSLL